MAYTDLFCEPLAVSRFGGYRRASSVPNLFSAFYRGIIPVFTKKTH
jgi:hypothetical protein